MCLYKVQKLLIHHISYKHILCRCHLYNVPRHIRNISVGRRILSFKYLTYSMQGQKQISVFWCKMYLYIVNNESSNFLILYWSQFIDEEIALMNSFIFFLRIIAEFLIIFIINVFLSLSSIMSATSEIVSQWNLLVLFSGFKRILLYLIFLRRGNCVMSLYPPNYVTILI